MSRYGNIEITSTYWPDQDAGCVILTNTDTDKMRWAFNCKTVPVWEAMKREIETLFKTSSCPYCLCQRINLKIDLPDEMKDNVRVIDGNAQ